MCQLPAPPLAAGARRLAGGLPGSPRARPGRPWRRRGVWTAARDESLAHRPPTDRSPLIHMHSPPSIPPAGSGHADVNIRADREDRVRLEVDTGEGDAAARRAPGAGWGGCAGQRCRGGLLRMRAHASYWLAASLQPCIHSPPPLPACLRQRSRQRHPSVTASTRAPLARSWPRDADEWKRLLSRAAPWIVAAAIAAASAYGWRENRVGLREGAVLGRLRRRRLSLATESRAGASLVAVSPPASLSLFHMPAASPSSQDDTGESLGDKASPVLLFTAPLPGAASLLQAATADVLRFNTLPAPSAPFAPSPNAGPQQGRVRHRAPGQGGDRPQRRLHLVWPAGERGGGEGRGEGRGDGCMAQH